MNLYTTTLNFYLSFQVPLEVLLKSEQKTEEMIDVLDTYQQYVQSVSDSDTSGTTRRVLLGGDQLTVERARSAQAVRSQSETSLQRLEGLHPKVEDWHAIVNFYQVCCTCIVLFAASVFCSTLHALISARLSSRLFGAVSTSLPPVLIKGPYTSYEMSSSAGMLCVIPRTIFMRVLTS